MHRTNTEQFLQRFLPLQQMLFREALALLGSKTDAEDAVQETYLRLWRQAGRVIAMEQAKGFFVKTLRNVCLNMIRSRRNMTSIEFIGNKTDDLETEQHELLFIEDRLRLRRAIAQLPPKARSMVTMFYLSQMTSQQIAEILGETDANVRSTLSRARVMLKNILLNNEKETRR
jgi:RNA polymerase sigma-70 factor (ECF subfamily)